MENYFSFSSERLIDCGEGSNFHPHYESGLRVIKNPDQRYALYAGEEQYGDSFLSESDAIECAKIIVK